MKKSDDISPEKVRKAIKRWQLGLRKENLLFKHEKKEISIILIFLLFATWQGPKGPKAEKVNLK